MSRTSSKENQTETENVPAASRAQILEALSPYIGGGSSDLSVRIGTSEIVLQREGRKFKAPRNASLDTLIDAAVELTGPLVEMEIDKALGEFKQKGLRYSITDEHVKMEFGKRTNLASIDCSLAHLVSTAVEMTSPREKFRPVTGEGNRIAAPGEIQE